MRHFLLLVVCLLTFSSSFAQNDFRSRQSGNWTDSDTWEEFTGSSWQNTGNIPGEEDGIITIESFMTISLSSTVTANQVVVLEDAFLDIISGGSLVLTDDAGDELDIAIGNGSTTFDGNAAVRSGGSLENQGSLLSSTTNFSISGEYIHNRNGGAIPPAGWAFGSKLTVRGVTNQAPTGFNISLSSFEWDCAAQSANVTIDGPLGDISENLTINNTNDQRLFLNGSGTINSTVGGDFMIGNFADVVLSNSGSTTLDVAGSVTNFGVLRLSVGGGSATLAMQENISSPGDIASTGTLSFTGSALQTVAITGSTSGAITYNIPDDAEIDLTTSVLGGSGSLIVGDDVILRTGFAEAAGAIQNNTTGGAIRVSPGSRTYGTNLEIAFNGTAAQHVGNGYPSVPGVVLRVNNPQGVSLTNDLTVTGNVLLSQGPLYLNGHHLTVEELIFSGTGFFIVPDENATLEILGSGNFGTLPLPSGSQSFGQLIIDRSGGAADIELTSDVIIHDDLVLTDGKLLLENNTLELRKDIITVNGEIETTLESGIRIAGSGPLMSIPFSNVTNDLSDFIYERAGTTYLTGDDIRIHGELGVYDGIIDNAADAIRLVDGASIRRIEGELINNVPALVSGMYHVYYEGTAKTAGVELPAATSPDDLGDLTISGGPVTIDKDIVINGDVFISSGDVLVSNADVTMRGGAWTNNAGSYTQTNGTLQIESNLTLVGNGTGQFDHINVVNGASLTAEQLQIGGDLLVDAGGLLTLNNSLLFNGGVDQQVHVQSAAIPEMVINKSGGMVSINEPLLLTGDLRIETASELASNGNLVVTVDVNDIFGGGRIDELPAGATITGNVVSEWYQSDVDPLGVSMYFGSTVADANIAGLQDDILVTGAFAGSDTGPVDPSLFYYDESTAGVIDNGWTAYPTTDDQAIIASGLGYQAFVMAGAPVTLDLSGTLHQGDITIPVTNTDSGTPASDGWNLVANPFASAIGWDELNGWNKSAVRGVIAVYNGGKFKYYNSSGAGQGTQLVLSNGVIAKHQAFWVQAITDGDLIIGEQAKVVPASITPPVSPANQMLLTLNDGSTTDQALIVVSPGATNNYDPGLDAPKLDNAGMDISTVAADGTPLAFNFLEPFGCGETIDVHIQDVNSGDYTLSVNTIASFDVPYLVTLRDNFLNVDHNVNNQPNYTFTIDDADVNTYENRFTILFDADLNDLVNEDLSYSAPGTICQGETGTVTFATSQAGVSYQLELNGSLYASPQNGTGATLFFDIDAADLQAANTLKVLATPAECATPVYLTEEKTITTSDLTPQILYAAGKLTSNYTAGNTWYLNDLSNQVSTANEITPTEEGTYILVVSVGGCSQSISYEYVVTAVESDLDGDISVYPNPVTGSYINVYLEQWNGVEALIDVMTVNGQLIESGMSKSGTLRLNVANYRKGVYILRIHTEENLVIKRFIRK